MTVYTYSGGGSPYSKKYLHPDENKFFISGERLGELIGNGNCALAICYEISVPQHAAQAAQDGARIYMASVAKSTSGIDRALDRLARIAREHSLIVLMSNSVGVSDGFDCAGKSSVRKPDGDLIARLDAEHVGIIVVDSLTLERFTAQVPMPT